MSVLPDGKVAKVEWCEAHITILEANAVAVGTTTLAVTDLQTKTEAARAAYLAQQEAQNGAKSATNTFNLAVDAMTAAAAEIIKQVKVKAGVVGDSVYSLADIPAPATPSPVGELGTPTHFVAVFDNNNGGLNLKWKCTNPRSATGTVYQVWRRIGGTGDYTFLGNAGGKQYIDVTIPAGSSQLTYKIRAVRSTSAGGWAQFNVNFGMNSSGSATAMVQPIASPKIAA